METLAMPPMSALNQPRLCGRYLWMTIIITVFVSCVIVSLVDQLSWFATKELLKTYDLTRSADPEQ